MNWLKLGIQLKVSRSTLYTWREMAGAPKTTDLGAWREFIEENGLGVRSQRYTTSRECSEATERSMANVELEFLRVREGLRILGHHEEGAEVATIWRERVLPAIGDIYDVMERAGICSPLPDDMKPKKAK